MEKNQLTVNELYEAVLQVGLPAAMCHAFGRHGKLRLRFSPEVYEMPVEELNLSVRGFNALKRNGIHTVGDAIDAVVQNRLASFRNLGQKTVCEIKTKLITYGYESLRESDKKAFLSELIAINTP